MAEQLVETTGNLKVDSMVGKRVEKKVEKKVVKMVERRVAWMEFLRVGQWVGWKAG
jgi:hypothetical protein